MSNLVTAIIQDRLESLDNARHEYTDLLRKFCDAPAPPEAVNRLKKLMEVLGRDAADVKEDAEILRRVRTLRKVIADGTGIDDEQEKARKALERHNANMQKAIDQLRKKQLELANAQAMVDRRYLNAQDAANELNRLRKQYPELLSDEPAVEV